MICIHCGHQQDLGNFCGKCGSKFGAVGTQPEVNAFDAEKSMDNPDQRTTTGPAKPNIYVESAKLKTKLYVKYFMQHLKKPSLTQNEGEVGYSNGLISIGLFAMLLGLSFYTIFANTSYSASSFYSTFAGIVFFTLASMGLVIVTLWLINNFFGPQYSFKFIVSLYGGHLSSLLLLAAMSLLLMLLKSFTFGSLTLILVFMFAVSLLPLYLIGLLVTKKSSSVDPFYGYVIYIVTLSISFRIFSVVLADSTVSSLLKEFKYFF